jgi:hypothetical protein
MKIKTKINDFTKKLNCESEYSSYFVESYTAHKFAGRKQFDYETLKSYVFFTL